VDKTQRKEFIRQTFDAVCDGYDNHSLRFFSESAAHLVDQLPLTGSEQVLDVATGTGAVALALAPRLAGGGVTGIDLSPGMLGRAADKAAKRGIANASFLPMDMTALDFPSGHFHCATAAFALFFVDDMEACLRGIVDCLKPGGHVAACSFSEDAFSPYVDLFLEGIERQGVQIPPMSWKRLATDDALRALYDAAGLKDIRLDRRDLSYRLPNADAWWDVLWNAGFRGLLNQLSESDPARFRAEHLAEISRVSRDWSIPLRVEVL